MTDLELMAKVATAKVFLEAKGYNVAYIGIYGSQNYGLAEYSDEYMSDVDFKAVIVPSLDDLVENSKPISIVIGYEGGQIEVKDVRKFTETLVKCNPAYVETLYTPYSIYSKEYEKIINEKEQLILEMGELLLRASYGMIMEKIKAFEHPYPSIAHKIKKFGYDPKQLHHIVRIFYLMENYKNTGEFNMKNPLDIKKELMMMKKGEMGYVMACDLRDHYNKMAKHLRDTVNIPVKDNAKKRVLKHSQDLIKKKIKDDIRGKSKKYLFNDVIWCPVCNSKNENKLEWINCNNCETSFKPLIK